MQCQEKLIFVQNFGDSAAAVQLDKSYENVLTGETVSGSLTIENTALQYWQSRYRNHAGSAAQNFFWLF